MKKVLLIFVAIICYAWLQAQTIAFEGKTFEAVNVTTSVTKINGKKALRVERNLAQLPFDLERMDATTDEPTFIKLVDADFTDGTIEVTLLSQLQDPLPFKEARGFIGVAFRINNANSAFENLYLRPTNGRSDNQFRRNHTIQYYAYPQYKFAKLREPQYKGIYETYADIGLNEWIRFRIEVENRRATVYINNSKHPSFIVSEMLGETHSGGIGLWVDIGTIGYFRDIKVLKR